ncbi:MAG: response regulator transcription factor [Candidatus Saccharimonadales bacterium]
MRILLVEDERKIATALKMGLASERFAVDVLYDGDEGLAYALDEPYDIMVLDRMLPGKDGVSIVREVRAAGIKTPILLLTAKDKISDRVEGLEAGADDYLIKPFAFEELLARIRSLLRRPVEFSDDTLSIDELALNTQSFEVVRSGDAVQLTQKEFALLEYMLRNPGRILTKDMIIQHVWNYDADVLPNTVEVYIGYLRGKIDKPFPDKKPLIHTVRGFGYKLEAAKK